ncbi:hypothetical protein [Candidatus Nitrososphaera gargensis]|nr:hypothetical protein [Candidatus Nitrososphaera gargensis]
MQKKKVCAFYRQLQHHTLCDRRIINKLDIKINERVGNDIVIALVQVSR